jgi:predicted dehydrogenase
MLFGSRGSLAAPDDRTGIPIRMELDDGTRVEDEQILDYAPSYQLDGVTAGLFGGDRIWRYDFDFATTDRKLLAAEYGEFAACIRDGMPPEVDGRAGKRAVALVNALFESQVAGRPVTLAEIESGVVAEYQREIDEHYGLAD